MSPCPPAEGLHIVAAGVAHADLMAALHERAFANPATSSPAWDMAAFAGLLAMPGVAGYLILRGEQPLGLSLWRFTLDEGELLTIGIDPVAQGGGLGTALLCHGMDIAIDLGVTHLFLEAAVTNTAALALYASLGFVRVGRRRHYYRVGDRLIDADVLSLSLTGQN
jgi:[ribosomal protein S18]-alanine N-acetyltransferase